MINIHSTIDWNDPPPLFKPDKIRVKEYWDLLFHFMK